MRIFLDAEFNETGKTIELISYALVAEDGRELYLCNEDFHPDCTEARASCNQWVQDNVFPLLPPAESHLWVSRDRMRQKIEEFIDEGIKIDNLQPEFWGYYADYDWVVLCWLWGAMVNLPKAFPKYCMDIKQWQIYLGKPRLPPKPADAHDALADARWHKKAWEFLASYEANLDTSD